MSDNLANTFWDRIEDVRAGLLCVEPDRSVPMSPMAIRKDNALWFITAAGTDAEKAASAGKAARFQVADPRAGLYADVQGTMTVSQDTEKLDALWNAIAAAWFEDGRADSDVRLIRFTPTEAEVWATESGLGFLYDVAKANLTSGTAEGGDHGRITF